MSNNDFNIIEGPMRNIAHSKLPPLLSTSQYPQPQLDNYNTPVKLVKIPGNPIRSPDLFQTISVSHTTSPPPTVISSKPAQCPPRPTENFGAVVMVPTPFQFKQEEEHEKEDQTDETPLGVDQDELETFHCYKELGEKLGSLLSVFKNRDNKLNAEKEILSAQLKEAEEINAFLNDKNEEIVKAQQEGVQYAISQETLWRTSCMELNEKVTTLEKESVEKNKLIDEQMIEVHDLEFEVIEAEKQLEEKENEIDTLKKKGIDNEKQLNEQNVKLSNLLELENQFNFKIEDQTKEIKSLREKYRNKCDQVLKSNENYNSMCTTNKELESKIDSLKKTDKDNKRYIQILETQGNHLTLTVKKLQATISNMSGEISKISQELEKERNDNQVKGLELEKSKKSVKDLEAEVKILQNEKDELPKKFNTFMSQFWNSDFPKPGRKRSVSSSSSSSSEKGHSLESSFSSKAMDNEIDRISTSNEAEQLESQKDVLQTVAIGKRKYPIKKYTTGKKHCGDGDANYSTDYDEHSHKLIVSLPLISQKFNTGGNAEIPEVSSSSRTSTSPPSSGRWQRNKSSCRQ